MHELVIQSSRGPYSVRFGSAFAGLEAGLHDHEHLVIDARVAEIYSDTLKSALTGPSVLRIDATESSKSLERLPAYVTHLLGCGVRRNHVLIAVGGGVVQDITAFLAATLLRGIRWRFYPTTLLAQADSCIGSKSSINVDHYKNQLGTFTPPDEVVVSGDVLDSLAEAELRSGIGEMIKAHIVSGWDDTRAIARDYERLIADRQLLLSYIRRSLEIKKAMVEADEFDRGERLVMNYGHSFGHALESATEYTIPHGIAVTIGMDIANYVSYRQGMVGREVYDELHRLLVANAAGFETMPIPETRFLAALARDKKHVGERMSLVLMRGPGRVFLDRTLEPEQVRALCRDYFESRPAPAGVPATAARRIRTRLA